MSLIQEALKRQQEDGESNNDSKKPSLREKPPVPRESKPTKEILPGISALPPEPLKIAAQPAVSPKSKDSAPPPPPPPPEQKKPATASNAVPPTQTPILESTGKPNRNKRILIGVVILLIIFVGIKLNRKTNDGTSETDSSPDKVLVDDAQAATSAETESNSSDAIATSPERIESEDRATADETATLTSETPSASTPKKIQWPSLTLTAVMGKGEKGSAMINGELIGVGDSVEGAEFLAVGKNGIYLQYKGESRFLKRGQTIF